jgi:hypothetical protein
MPVSRYAKLKFNGEMRSLPKIKISNRSTDIFVTYNPNKTRLDRIAADAYGDDTLYWLILLANPQYYMEFNIPSGAVIRVPNPISDVLSEFNSKILNSNYN